MVRGNDDEHGNVVELDKLPQHLSTLHMPPDFWEGLGRAVADFGYLEDVLGRAIHAMTTWPHDGQVLSEQEFEAWLKEQDRARSEPLRNLISKFVSLANSPAQQSYGVERVSIKLRELAEIRNVICHGCWMMPGQSGYSIPSFMKPNGDIFNAPIDIDYLANLGRNVEFLACEVINVVTVTGCQFPGSGGPGRPIELPTHPTKQ